MTDFYRYFENIYMFSKKKPLPSSEMKPHLTGGKKIPAFLSTKEPAFLRKRFKVPQLPPLQTLDGSSLL